MKPAKCDQSCSPFAPPRRRTSQSTFFHDPWLKRIKRIHKCNTKCSIMRVTPTSLFFLTCVWQIFCPIVSQAAPELTADEFYQRLVTGDYDVIVDVRSVGEWDAGRIPNATLVESLASYTTNGGANNDGTPADLAGCEYCRIIVYCRSGNRARTAIQILRDNGFQQLWNGMGINQWTDANYSLVFTPSVVPPCTLNDTVSDTCRDKYLGDIGTECDQTQGNAQDRCIEIKTSSSPRIPTANLWLCLSMGAFLLALVPQGFRACRTRGYTYLTQHRGD